VIGLGVAGANAQEAKYPPLSEYMMARDAEIALAKSAAPDFVSDHATIKFFTASGFQVRRRLIDPLFKHVSRSIPVRSEKHGFAVSSPGIRKISPLGKTQTPGGR
jgi:hypothetical protein